MLYYEALERSLDYYFNLAIIVTVSSLPAQIHLARPVQLERNAVTIIRTVIRIARINKERKNGET